MYLFDSDTFIGASRLYYSFDLAPGFWDWLASAEVREQVASVEAVRDEITAGTGALVDWAKARPDDFWLPHTADSLNCGSALSEWVTHPDRLYTQPPEMSTWERRTTTWWLRLKRAGTPW